MSLIRNEGILCIFKINSVNSDVIFIVYCITIINIINVYNKYSCNNILINVKAARVRCCCLGNRKGVWPVKITAKAVYYWRSA